MENNIKIETYKKVDLFYSKSTGKILFSFEGNERVVKYVFEAREIIDEPQWEECNLEGYVIEGVFHDYIGTAIAKRIDIKSGEPYWKIKGEYDLEYKRPTFYSDSKLKVYPKNEHNTKIYKQFEEQRDVVNKEKRKLQDILKSLE